jgi:hypothetical protein
MDGWGYRTVWPKYTQFPPRLGDFIQASSGERKKIIEIIHSVNEEGDPLTVLILGSDTTSVTPTEGGAYPST